jgi:hypothetical protein
LRSGLSLTPMSGTMDRQQLNRHLRTILEPAASRFPRNRRLRRNPSPRLWPEKPSYPESSVILTCLPLSRWVHCNSYGGNFKSPSPQTGWAVTVEICPEARGRSSQTELPSHCFGSLPQRYSLPTAKPPQSCTNESVQYGVLISRFSPFELGGSVCPNAQYNDRRAWSFGPGQDTSWPEPVAGLRRLGDSAGHGRRRVVLW